jgi:mannose-6-phosphate isomerase-like protein (cupin superfamily)
VTDPTNLHRTDSFVTADGSSIREVAGRVSQPTRNQSLAEATVPPGGETAEHFHVEAEEVYLFTRGRGRMRLGDEEFDIADGDCVVIGPGRRHKLWNPGGEPLVLLCACAPAYRHEDTVLTGG